MSADARLCILVFARAPIPGSAKTRLAPAIGAEGAARLQERMTQHVLRTARSARLGPIALWCAPSLEHSFFRSCRDTFSVSLHLQCGEGLGERLRAAHDATFGRFERMLLIGTDCPILDVSTLRQCAAALGRTDAVLVPAEDGGYVLLGLRRPCAAAFAGIEWGSERVASQTLERFRSAGVSCEVRAALWDVDRPDDLSRLARHIPHLLEGLVTPL